LYLFEKEKNWNLLLVAIRVMVIEVIGRLDL